MQNCTECQDIPMDTEHRGRLCGTKRIWSESDLDHNYFDHRAKKTTKDQSTYEREVEIILLSHTRSQTMGIIQRWIEAEKIIAPENTPDLDKLLAYIIPIIGDNGVINGNIDIHFPIRYLPEGIQSTGIFFVKSMNIQYIPKVRTYNIIVQQGVKLLWLPKQNDLLTRHQESTEIDYMDVDI